MQYLIIFSCGWVINHFGFNLLRCYCCCCCFSSAFFSFAVVVSLVQHTLHRAKALTVFSFALLLSTFSQTYTFIVKSMFRNRVYFCVDLSIFIGYRVHFHSAFLQRLGITAACQHGYIYTFAWDSVCSNSLKQGMQPQLSDWSIFLLTHSAQRAHIIKRRMRKTLMYLYLALFNSVGLHETRVERTRPSHWFCNECRTHCRQTWIFISIRAFNLLHCIIITITTTRKMPIQWLKMASIKLDETASCFIVGHQTRKKRWTVFRIRFFLHW